MKNYSLRIKTLVLLLVAVNALVACKTADTNANKNAGTGAQNGDLTTKQPFSEQIRIVKGVLAQYDTVPGEWLGVRDAENKIWRLVFESREIQRNYSKLQTSKVEVQGVVVEPNLYTSQLRVIKLVKID